MTAPGKAKERVNLSNTEKEIFWNIKKNSDDGKVCFLKMINFIISPPLQLYKTVVSGVTTNDQKHSLLIIFGKEVFSLK